ncbi:hypothetical protein B0H14DRAFT_2932235, partial [Mycena olivaceomarginata]
ATPGLPGRRAGDPPSPLLQPIPLVRPSLYVVALVPALGLMQFLFLAFVLSPRAQQRDREAEAEVGRGAEFFQMQSPACAATARSSLLKMVVMRACYTGQQTRRHWRRRRQPRTRRLGTDEAGVPSRITIPVSIPPHLSLTRAEMQTQPNPS